MTFVHRPHPRIAQRAEAGPPRLAHHHGAGFAAWLAVRVTTGVATMTCAGVFALLALVALPSALQGGIFTTVQWISQTFIQLVMLSIIMVGQQILGKAGDERAEATWKDSEAVLAEALQIQAHLAHQDAILATLIATREAAV